VGVRARLVAMEGGVSYEKDERVFSDVSGVAWVSLPKDCTGLGGMIASFSLGGGAVDGDCRVAGRSNVSKNVTPIGVWPCSPHDGRELSWPQDSGPLRASVPAGAHNAAI
jgi:hypothetical protein